MSSSIIKTPVQYCMTLKFATALLKKDHHELIAFNKRKLEWAVNAYAQFGDELVACLMPGQENSNELADPYGPLVYHIINYDKAFGHSPSFEQLCDYMKTLRHGPDGDSLATNPWFGKDTSKTEDFISVLEQYLEDNEKPDAEREWGAPEEAEVMLPAFIERAKRLRMQILCKKTERLARGDELVFDQKLKKKRRSTYSDAVGQLNRLLQFDLAPESNGGTGILPELPKEALYGWLGKKALESSIPHGFLYPALVGVYAGKQIAVTDKAIHPCLNIALVADVETGKSQAIEQAEKALDMRDMGEGGSVCHRSASSDRGLFNIFGDDPKQKDAPIKSGKTYVMCLTELRHMFTKMAMQNNSLPPTLCSMWDNGKDNGTADKYKNVGCRVNLSIVGGLKCKNMEEFGDVFGADTMHGLFSRFILGISNEKWNYRPFSGVPESRNPCEITITDECWARLDEWKAQKPGRGRLGENAMRWAVITEAAEQGGGFTQFTESDIFNSLDVSNPQPVQWEEQKPSRADLSLAALEAALLVMEHQEIVKAAYTPSEALNDDAKVTEAILKALDESGSFKWNMMCKNRHWTQKWGANKVRSVRDGLVATGQIKYDADSGWVEPV